MNVPRYWRMQKHNYRLTGVAYNNGQKSIVNRPRPVQQPQAAHAKPETKQRARTQAA